MIIKNLILKAKKQIYGERLGNHPSKVHGEGFEFSELREYVYGDDVRKIDWNSSAKTNKTYIKVYNEEREFNVAVAVMLGGSTYFGTARQKSETMMEAVAMIGMAAIGASDTFSGYLFSDKLYQYIKPTKRAFGVHQFLDSMNSFKQIGKISDYSLMSDELNRRLKHKTLLYIVADFVGDINFAKLSKKHDITLICVRDRFEENPFSLGYIGLVDIENGTTSIGDVNEKKISKYKKAIDENDIKLFNHCNKYGMRMVKIYTDENVYISLKRGIR